MQTETPAHLICPKCKQPLRRRARIRALVTVKLLGHEHDRMTDAWLYVCREDNEQRVDVALELE